MVAQWKAISTSFDKVSTEVSSYHDAWVCDKTFMRACRTRYPGLINLSKFDVEALNRALGKKYGDFYDLYDASNVLGIFSITFRTKCPYDSSITRDVRWYFRSSNGNVPDQPQSPAECPDVIANTERARKDRERIPAAERDARSNDDAAKAIQEAILAKNKKQASQSNKPNNISNEQNPNGSGSTGSTDDVLENGSGRGGSVESVGGDGNKISPEEARKKRDTIAKDLFGNGVSEEEMKNIYWQSNEARLLFGFERDDELVDVREALTEKIELLKEVNSTEGGYQKVIPMTEDSSTCISSHNIFVIRHKSLFLLRAYQIALEKMRVGVQFVRDCCTQEAIKELNSTRIMHSQSAQTIGKWNREFRKLDLFDHPNVHVRNGKKPKPPIFEMFPHLEAVVSKYILKNLDCFTIEMLRNYLFTEVVPKLVKDSEDRCEQESLGYKLLVGYIDKTPSYSTVLRWVHNLNFKYKTKSKSYMVDGHEHEEQQNHRKKFTMDYITQHEPRCHR